jgi:sporulation protein YlmC with PRC-barrel domain
MRILYEEALVGRRVLDATGRSIGEVDGLMLDPQSWRVEALRVKLDKDVTEEIHAPKGMFRAARLDIPVEFIQDVSDAVLLKGPVASLQTLEQHPPSY